MSVAKSVLVFAASVVTFAGWSADAAAPATRSPFSLLPLCRQVEGTASVRQPNCEWAAAEEGKFYPLGSSFRTDANSKMVVAFGQESVVTIDANSEFGTRSQEIGASVRKIVLVGGTVGVKLPDNMPEGAFVVAAPGFVVKNPAGESRYEYAKVGDGDRAVVRCVTGAMSVEGRHFEISAMRAADEFSIDTSSDNLVTELGGRSGDFIVKIDQGIASVPKIDDSGKVEDTVKKTFNEWRLSPKTRVRITRALPSIGERMSVHTLCFDASGACRGECSFCENRAEINSGELVPRENDNQVEVAKKAAEATTEEADDEEEPKDDKGEKASSEEE